MNTETKLREALAGQANTIEIGALASVDELAGAAGRRNRRNRVVAGAGALMLAFFVALGFGSLVNGSETSLTVADEITEDIAAQLEGQRLRPSAIVPGPDGIFAGLTPVELNFDGDATEVAFVTAVSDDGLSWDFVAGSPAWRFTEAQMVEQDGDFHIVGIKADQLTAATSNDLVDWSQEETKLDSADFFLFDVVIGDELGAVVLEVTGADERRSGFEGRLMDIGVDPADICELAEVDGGITYRLCGTESFGGEVPHQGAVDAADVTSQIYTGPPGEPLAFQRNGTATGSIFGRGFRSRIDGFGVAVTDADDRRVEVLLGGLYPSMDLEEFRVASPAADDFGNPVVRGHGGWALVVHRWDRLRPVVSGPVHVVNEQFEFRGQYPFGPATLTSDDGGLLRSWDQFEFPNLGWSGVDVAADGVSIRTSGEATAVFTHEEWADGLTPNRASAVSDVVYSPDGRTWAVIATLDSLVKVTAVGSEAVLVESVGPGDVYQFTSPPVLLDIPIPIPERLEDTIAGTVRGEAPDEVELAEAMTASEPAVIESTTSSSSGGFDPEENEYGELVRVDFTPSGLPEAAEVADVVTTASGGLGRSSEAATQLAERGFEIADGSTVEHVALFASGGANSNGYAIEFYLVSDEQATSIRIARRDQGQWETSSAGWTAVGSDYRLMVPRKLWVEFDEGVILSRAPSNAAWFVVERFDGSVVKAPVVDGFSAAVWPREEGRPLQFSVQDADGVEIYAEILDIW